MELGNIAVQRRDVELLMMVSGVASQLSDINDDSEGEFVSFFDVAEYFYELSLTVGRGQTVESNEWANDLKRRLDARSMEAARRGLCT